MQSLQENAINADGAAPVDTHVEVKEMGVLDSNYIFCAVAYS